MAEDANHGQAARENLAMPTNNKRESGTETIKMPRKGIFSRMWNGIFRSDDIEKRLQHITKEETSVLARMKRRSQNFQCWKRNLISASVILEFFAVGYAIMTTRSLDLDWKMRALRVLPMFLLPGLSYFWYRISTGLTRMRDRKDQETLERLHAERKAKIDQLKERTNYYITQQLIQRYDPDPAAKAAAATVLASKMGAESGLKVYVGDESNPSTSSGKSNDVEFVKSSGLRNRKHSHSRSSSAAGNITHQLEEVPHDMGLDGAEINAHNETIVEHTPRSPTHDGGWIARFAALLVGEDPTQSYALICGNCHMHNGLARKEDFLYITYYCPHCRALNKSRQSQENPHVSSSTNLSAPTTPTPTPTPSSADVDNFESSSITDSKLTSSSPAAEAAEEVDGSVSETTEEAIS